MSYKIEFHPSFSKQLKRLVKKYPSLKAEFIDLATQLQTNPERGIPLGNSCYKIRIAVASKGKGKSGGARAIYYIQISETLVVFLSIYDKSEQEDISDKELKGLLASLL